MYLFSSTPFTLVFNIDVLQLGSIIASADCKMVHVTLEGYDKMNLRGLMKITENKF